MIPAELVPSLLQYLQIPEIKWDIRSEWNSQNPQHRQEIHTEKNRLLPKDWNTSISHCGQAGGFIAAPEPYRVGFDIEIISRVKPEIAKRICEDPEEALEAPSPSSLWVAKEACFKALFEIQQPAVVSSIEIGDWSKSSDEIECFKLRFLELQRTPPTWGAVLKIGELKLGFLALNSQLWSGNTEKFNVR